MNNSDTQAPLLKDLHPEYEDFRPNENLVTARIKLEQLERQNQTLRNTIFSERQELLAMTRKLNKEHDRTDYLVIGVGAVCLCCGLVGGFYLQLGASL